MLMLTNTLVLIWSVGLKNSHCFWPIQIIKYLQIFVVFNQLITQMKMPSLLKSQVNIQLISPWLRA